MVETSYCADTLIFFLFPSFKTWLFCLLVLNFCYKVILITIVLLSNIYSVFPIPKIESPNSSEFSLFWRIYSKKILRFRRKSEIKFFFVLVNSFIYLSGIFNHHVIPWKLFVEIIEITFYQEMEFICLLLK